MKTKLQNKRVKKIFIAGGTIFLALALLFGLNPSLLTTYPYASISIDVNPESISIGDTFSFTGYVIGGIHDYDYSQYQARIYIYGENYFSVLARCDLSKIPFDQYESYF